MSDATLPPPNEALLSDLLRGLRHELNNRAHLLGLSLPMLRAVTEEAVTHLQAQGTGAPTQLGGVPLEGVGDEVGWLLDELDERDAALTRQVDALKRAMLGEAATTAGEVLTDATLLTANHLLKVGAHVVQAPRGLDIPAPAGGGLLRSLCCLLLEAPPRSVGAMEASVTADHDVVTLVLVLPSAAERWRAAIARARAALPAPFTLTLDDGPPPAVRFGWPPS